MKINFTYPNNNSTQSQKSSKMNKVSFGAGLTAKFKQEIMNADVIEISNRLAKKGIPTDFKDNKAIAWCSEKSVDIFQHLNEKYKLKLALPKGIFVEDFEGLNIDNPSIRSFCNPSLATLKRNSNEEIPAQTVFFNTFETLLKNTPKEIKYYYDWNSINEIADEDFINKGSSTNYFLYCFLHEFAHVQHEDKLLKKIGEQALDKKLDLMQDEKRIEEYQNKYGQKLSKICDYALTNEFEAIGCDMPKRIIDTLDKTTLLPISNPFIGTPYEKLPLLKRISIPFYSDEERPLDEILRNFWNGNFE